MGVPKRMNKKGGNRARKLKTEDIFEDFINEKVIKGLVDKSIKGYRDSFTRFIAFSDETKDMENIDRALVNRWISSMKEQSEPKLSASSINSHIRNVRAFLYWCMNHEQPKLQQFKISEITVQEEKLKDFEQDEVQKLLKKPEKVSNNYNEWREWAICNFVYATGARTSTFLSIRLEDLDFKKKKIYYRHTKNKAYQTMTMSRQLAKVLKEFIDNYHDIEDQEQYLFANIKGGELNGDAFRNAFRRYATRRGVSKTNIHGIRHTYAREWIMNGGDIVQLQKILGHSSIRMTEKYLRIYGEGLPDDFELHNPLDVMNNGRNRERKMKPRK